MSILVTGGAGFIGNYVCRELLKDGEHVVCIDDFNDYYDPKLKEHRIKDLVQQKNFVLYRADIRNLGRLRKIFAKNKIKAVVHLAARAGVRASIENPLLYQSVNIEGTMNLLELGKAADNFVFASSSSVYGANTKIPFSEEDPVNTPMSPYAATKRAGELMCYAYHHLYKMPITCLRFFTVYGPMGRPDMSMFKFTKSILEGIPLAQFGDGTSKRDYTYITDNVSGIIAALRKPHSYEIINLGNSNPVELRRVIALIEKEAGKKAKVKQLCTQQGDVAVTFADIRKAKRLLGYHPKVRIEEGVANLVKWYKEYTKDL
jgi:UDP-glucuronate 4-epimerase